jgi:hypothetical protein
MGNSHPVLLERRVFLFNSKHFEANGLWGLWAIGLLRQEYLGLIALYQGPYTMWVFSHEVSKARVTDYLDLMLRFGGSCSV